MTTSKTLELPRTMLAARVYARGEARFHLDELPAPEPQPGQVLIRVESAAVNFSDVKRRRGDLYPFETVFPFIPGGEIAGTVVAHGPGVAGPPIGTKVFALAGPNGFGGYAQYAVSYAPTVVPIPEGLSLDVASVLTVAGATAKVMLSQTASLRAGESVFVPAAAGGVGAFALQLARQLDAGKIIAGVGTTSKAKLAKTLGAHEVVDTSEADWPARVLALTGDRGVDVALEATGGESLERTLRCLAPFGRLVVYGAASGQSGTLSRAALDRLFYAPAANQTITGFNIGAWFLERPGVAGPALGALLMDVLQGRIQAPPIEALPLATAQSVHERLERRETSGKMVLKPWA